jgi:NAD(P)-dependent dehydrogenase (short-subunit alcohol dehydrogenase family)
MALLTAGAAVIVTYRRTEEYDGLRRDAGADALLDGFSTDVTDEAQVAAFVSECITRHGHIDILINTVGGYKGGKNLWETDLAVLDQMIALNLRSGFVLSRAVVPVMLKQGRGSIVNIAAKAALHPAAKGAAYAASKAAAVAMLDSLAQELKGTGVRVNTVLPSIIDTEPNRKSMPNADFTKWPKPDEIAQVIAYLCSDESRLIHGAAIPVYGQS